MPFTNRWRVITSTVNKLEILAKMTFIWTSSRFMNDSGKKCFTVDPTTRWEWLRHNLVDDMNCEITHSNKIMDIYNCSQWMCIQNVAFFLLITEIELLRKTIFSNSRPPFCNFTITAKSIGFLLDSLNRCSKFGFAIRKLQMINCTDRLSNIM